MRSPGDGAFVGAAGRCESTGDGPGRSGVAGRSRNGAVAGRISGRGMPGVSPSSPPRGMADWLAGHEGRSTGVAGMRPSDQSGRSSRAVLAGLVGGPPAQVGRSATRGGPAGAGGASASAGGGPAGAGGGASADAGSAAAGGRAGWRHWSARRRDRRPRTGAPAAHWSARVGTAGPGRPRRRRTGRLDSATASPRRADRRRTGRRRVGTPGPGRPRRRRTGRLGLGRTASPRRADRRRAGRCRVGTPGPGRPRRAGHWWARDRPHRQPRTAGRAGGVRLAPDPAQDGRSAGGPLVGVGPPAQAGRSTAGGARSARRPAAACLTRPGRARRSGRGPGRRPGAGDRRAPARQRAGLATQSGAGRPRAAGVRPGVGAASDGTRSGRGRTRGRLGADRLVRPG